MHIWVLRLYTSFNERLSGFQSFCKCFIESGTYARPAHVPTYTHALCLNRVGLSSRSCKLFQSSLFLVICKISQSTNMFFYASIKCSCTVTLHLPTVWLLIPVSLLLWLYSPFWMLQ